MQKITDSVCLVQLNCVILISLAKTANFLYGFCCSV